MSRFVGLLLGLLLAHGGISVYADSSKKSFRSSKKQKEDVDPEEESPGSYINEDDPFGIQYFMKQARDFDNYLNVEDLYREKQSRFHKFDKLAYKIIKSLWSIADRVGIRGWNAMSPVGDRVFAAEERYRTSRIGRSERHNNQYMFADYDEEFDITMEDQAIDHLEERRFPTTFEDEESYITLEDERSDTTSEDDNFDVPLDDEEIEFLEGLRTSQLMELHGIVTEA